MDKYLKTVDDLLQRAGEKAFDGSEDLAERLHELRAYLGGIGNSMIEFEEIANHLYDGIYVADGEGNTLFINNAYTRITGITPDMVLGRNVDDIVKDGYIYKNPVTSEVIKEKKTVSSIGESLLNKKKMLITGSPILDEQGKVTKVVINNRALTDLDELKSQLEKTQNKLKTSQEEHIVKNYELKHFRKNQIDSSSFVGECLALENIKTLVEQVAPTDASVLITGETGTGKEIVANEIVKNSQRSEKPFIKINCSAIPENLLESELFGYEKGAFTGASKDGHLGLFEVANGGTLMLDEIGDMPLKLQSKLLRVLQDKEVLRIGAHRSVPVDVRIISSTNKDLRQAIAEGRFREDLYYRINVLPITLPPLAERGDDLLLFKDYFLDKYNKKYEKDLEFNSKTIRILQHYKWPGNIREFENIVERLVIIAKDSDAATAIVEAMLQVNDSYATNMDQSYREIVQGFERQLIKKALEKYRTTTEAAKHLKLDQSTIVKKKKRLGIK
jgi:PAS domain S-box-containing protein